MAEVPQETNLPTLPNDVVKIIAADLDAKSIISLSAVATGLGLGAQGVTQQQVVESYNDEVLKGETGWESGIMGGFET